ncbi:hypothetical protein RI129_011381 [Pyrocoelia pectoralis]|uniref:Uncharacterized protein n=1 Tax=Pyrocoelia pectoralis TaxID=417401 RepID=A0AAN7V107_9COLE
MFLKVLCVLNLFVWVNCCKSFGDVNVQIRQNSGTSIFNRTIKGCVSRKTFTEDNHVSHVWIVDQPVQRLLVGAVENTPHLSYVEFSKCKIESIQPRAFRNVPILETIHVEYGLLQEIKRDVFNIPLLRELSLAHNQISKIEARALAITELKKLYLSNNKLTKWYPEWFASIQAAQINTDAFNQLSSKPQTKSNETNKLEKIDIKNNLLTTLPLDAFQGLPNLKILFLNSNLISNIEPGTFFGTKLHSLGLANNRLKFVDPKWFPKPFHLTHLSLNANKFNFIPLELFDRVAPQTIAFDGNPMSCGCWKKIVMAIHNTTYQIETTDGCHLPNVPFCVGTESDICEEVIDDNVSRAFYEGVMGALRNSNKTVKKECYTFM